MLTRFHVLKVLKGYDDSFEYPKEVIREAIINALIHRDYTLGTQIYFQMFNDRIVVKSPGHLLDPNSIERMNSFDVTPVRRNQMLASAASSLKLIEREGYGIPNMPRRLKDYGLRPPKFDFDGGNFIVTFFGREHSSPKYRLSSNVRSELTSRQVEILELIWERKRIVSQDIVKKFKISKETATKDLKKLIKLGLIKRKGSGRATYYVYG